MLNMNQQSFPEQVIQVFQIGEGGLGGELHLYQPNEPIELKRRRYR